MLLDLAGWKNVLYMDTDSLIVGEKGFQRLQSSIDSLKLGHLKVEGITDNLEILAKKAYRFGGRDTIKGIKRNARKTGANTYVQEYFTTLNYAFKAGNLGGVQTYEAKVRVQNVVTNALVAPDGTVRPRRMSMRQADVYAIVEPETLARWTWWVDVSWLASLGWLEYQESLPV